MSALRSGELFAGVGGLSMAVDAVFDADPAWFAEIDEAPAKVLVHHWPDVPNLGDVSTVDWTAPELAVEVLAGGFPCQDVSLAGRRKGMAAGTRSGLWSEFAQAIDSIRPSWVVIENVRGLLSASASRGEDIEYDCGVCGWTGGRRGLHRDSRASSQEGRDDVLRGTDHGRNDGTGSPGARRDSAGMGRVADSEQGGDRNLGDGLGVESARQGSGGRLSPASALSESQARASSPVGRDGRVQGGAPKAQEWSPDLVDGSSENVPDVQGTDTRAERERPACPDCGGGLVERADSEMEPCPWCLGDETGEHALRALGAVLGDLAGLGFDAEWVSVRASDVGAPHGRFRIFILAWPAENTGYGFGRQTQPGTGGRDDATRGSDRGGSGSGHDSDLTRARVFAGDWGDWSLLPTPVAQPSGNTPEDHLRKKPGRTVVTDLAVMAENGLIGSGGQLLPTPGAYDGDRGGSQHPDKRREGGHSVTLQDAAEHLMPTPKAGDGVFASPRTTGRPPEKATHLSTRLEFTVPSWMEAERTREAQVTDWGPYAAAVAHWEAVLGRPAPSPVRMDGKGGKPRLNPELTEWMMGWPEGWVTAPEIGLTRAQQLKACGNGVVSLQAAAAIRHLLSRVGVPALSREVAA